MRVDLGGAEALQELGSVLIDHVGVAGTSIYAAEWLQVGFYVCLEGQNLCLLVLCAMRSAVRVPLSATV